MTINSRVSPVTLLESPVRLYVKAFRKLEGHNSETDCSTLLGIRQVTTNLPRQITTPTLVSDRTTWGDASSLSAYMLSLSRG
jgi:hypothetical protein